MKVFHNVLPNLLIVLLIAAFATGCVNIFGFTTDKEETPVAKAEEEIRNGNYEKAKGELSGLIDAGTTDSMILYTFAKASLLDAGIDLATIVDLVQGETDVEVGFNNPILDKIDQMSVEEQNAWYSSNTNVSQLMKRIYHEETTGVFSKEDIALDFTISNVLATILGLRDTNQDGVIDYSTDVQLDLISFGGLGDIEDQGFVLGNIETDEQGNPVLDENNLPKNTGLTVFLGDYTAKQAAVSLTANGKPSPDDINTILAFVLSKLDEGEESIMFLINTFAGDSEEGSSIDYDDIKDYIFDIGKYVNYYWYDDGEDNDGDGRVDEETIDGVDNDGDGLIDEDSDYHPADETKVENTQHRGLWISWSNRNK